MADAIALSAQVTTVLESSLGLHGTTPIEQVAAQLFISKSTLQRGRAREGTCFTSLRQRVAVDMALGLLLGGDTLAKASTRVVVSQDHLTRLVRERCGLCPRQIARVNYLSRRATHWRKSPSLKTGTRLYWTRYRAWSELEAEVASLTSRVTGDLPVLRRWRRAALGAARRPDYRKGTYRRASRTARRRERREEARYWAAMAKAFDRWDGADSWMARHARHMAQLLSSELKAA